MSTPFSFSIATMGCKANLTDSQDLEARLKQMGGRAALAGEDADVFVLNTCTVTDQADKEAAQILRKSVAPLVIATGCLAEVDPQKLKRESGALSVVRNSGKNQIANVIADWQAGSVRALTQGDRAEWHKKADHQNNSAIGAQAVSRTRAFLKVQDGCNAFCSYCIIPFARGRSRSIAAKTIVSEVRSLVEQGIKEVILTAIHAADYDDDGLDFTALIEKVLLETRVPRLRLTSLDPAEIPDRLLDLMDREPRLCPHFHVSIQSASTRVLKAMKRAYTADQVESCLKKIAARLPHAFVGMDIIAGFPGETDQDFEESFALLERTPWSRLHVFPYSLRRNTAAEKMVKDGMAVPAPLIKARAARLRLLGEARFAIIQKNKVGAITEILVENTPYKKGDSVYSVGHTRNYFKVALAGSFPGNSLLRVKLGSSLNKEILLAEVV